MKIRSLRVPDDLWDAALVRAADADEKISDVLRAALETYTAVEQPPCTECGDGDQLAVTVDDDVDDDEPTEDDAPEADDDDDDDAPETDAAIIGTGRLSESDDPETASAVARVKELLLEGAVGVSIMHDLDPNTMPTQEQIEAAEKKGIDTGDWSDLDALFKDVLARPRHLAIVDTPAFSDARLTLGEDGFSVSGPITFEGRWTGDVRRLPYGVLVWDDVLPIPILWDRNDGDHTGMTVGFIDSMDRIDGVTASLAFPAPTEDQLEAVTAAAHTATGADAIPARWVADPGNKQAVPLTISAPDPRGLRYVSGTAAPRGVCHRSDMGACFQYPGDVDPKLRGFHTGALVTLDDGTATRLGALTLGGRHIDADLARRGVTAYDVGRHRDDANTVFALVRAYDKPHGLDIAGVVLPGVTDKQVFAALGCSPSVELWPAGRGRTTVGIHLVPTPAWPVAASAGSTTFASAAAPVQAEDVEEAALELEAVEDTLELDGRLDRIERALALLVADKLAVGVDLPAGE